MIEENLLFSWKKENLLLWRDALRYPNTEGLTSEIIILNSYSFRQQLKGLLQNYQWKEPVREPKDNDLRL